LEALPKNAFDLELPEMDVFYLDEIEQLRIGLASLGGEAEKGKDGLGKAWDALRKAGKGWGWDIGQLKPVGVAGAAMNDGDDESDEEGEYAPQIVET
jgi:A1 cistron-splicing factor AAR2